MDLNQEIVIELDEYGMPGEKIVMSEPTLRRKNMMMNALRKCFGDAKFDKKNPLNIGDMAFGDLEITLVMGFVKSSPFKQTVDDFLNFSDKLDEIKVGNASAVYDKMKEAMEKINGGETSPLED